VGDAIDNIIDIAREDYDSDYTKYKELLLSRAIDRTHRAHAAETIFNKLWKHRNVRRINVENVKRIILSNSH